MSKTIPPEAMEPDFLTVVRNMYVGREYTALRLQLATYFLDDLGRSYLDGALSKSRKEIHTILLGIMNYRPDEDDDEPGPDHRAPAALLFLYGVNAAYWPATPEEMDLARALAITTYGPEVLKRMKPEKTKDDLAREAGVPNVSFTYEKPRDGRTAKQIVNDYLYIQTLSDEAELIGARKPIDLDALGVALKRYLDALKQYFPSAYEVQTEHLRRALAPAIGKAYADII